MKESQTCATCDHDASHEYFDWKHDRSVSVCEDHYRGEMRPDRANHVMPPGMKRMNARLAKVALDQSLEPTDMERYLNEQELLQEALAIKSRLAEMDKRYGEEQAAAVEQRLGEMDQRYGDNA